MAHGSDSKCYRDLQVSRYFLWEGTLAVAKMKWSFAPLREKGFWSPWDSSPGKSDCVLNRKSSLRVMREKSLLCRRVNFSIKANGLQLNLEKNSLLTTTSFS